MTLATKTSLFQVGTYTCNYMYIHTVQACTEVMVGTSIQLHIRLYLLNYKSEVSEILYPGRRRYPQDNEVTMFG